MTQTNGARHRDARTRTYLMCPPRYFAVEYAINPWMNPDEPVNTALAMHRWWQLREPFIRLGHVVHTIDPRPGLPAMVFAGNGAPVIGGAAIGARFRHPQRAAEGPAYLAWLRRSGYAGVVPRSVDEGEGDIAFSGRAIIAGHGFRTDEAVKSELEGLFGLPVLSVRLVDPRFYHLDTALCVLDADTAAYYPAAFDDAGRAALAGLFAGRVEAKHAHGGTAARAGRGPQRSQLSPAAGGDRRSRGRLGDRRRGPSLPGPARRVLGGQLRAPPSPAGGRGAAPAGAGHPGQPGVRA